MDDKHADSIGFLTCASQRVNLEAALCVHRLGARALARTCQELGMGMAQAEAVPPSDSKLERALEAICGARPIAVILHCAGWTEDETVLKIVDLFQCPVMLWVTDDVLVDGVSQLVAHVGYMEACSCLRKMNRSFFRLYGGPDAQSDSELKSFVAAVKAREELRRLRFGWIGQGYGSGGMLDGVFDEQELEDKLGLRFVKIPLDEVFKRWSDVSMTYDSPQIDRLHSLGVNTRVLQALRRSDPAAVDDSLRFLLALAGTVEDHDLQALSLRCFPEFKQNNTPSPCMAVSALNQRGIPCSCEGDVLSGVSMFILSRLSGRAATMVDLIARDDTLNTVELFHCGSAAASLACPEVEPEYRTHCKPRNHRAGVTVEFPLAQGEVSFLKLDMLGKGRKLFYYSGTALPPGRALRGNYARVRTTAPVKHLIETLLDHGASHHQVLSYGDVRKEATYFARLAGCELVSL